MTTLDATLPPTGIEGRGIVDLSELSADDDLTSSTTELQNELALARARVQAWLELTSFCESRVRDAYDRLVQLEGVQL